MIISKKRALIRAINFVAKNIGDKELILQVYNSGKFARESLERIKSACKKSMDAKFNEEYASCDFKNPQELWDAIKEFYVYKYNLDESRFLSRDTEWVEARCFYSFIANEMCLGNPSSITKPLKRGRCLYYYSIKTARHILSSSRGYVEKKQRFEELRNFITN